MANKDSGHTHRIHRIRAQDKTGKWAQYFLLMEAAREPAFLKAAKSQGDIDLKQFGVVIASFYGDTPPADVKKLMREKYAFEV
jgi:hypothetical protein